MELDFLGRSLLFVLGCALIFALVKTWSKLMDLSDLDEAFDDFLDNATVLAAPARILTALSGGLLDIIFHRGPGKKLADRCKIFGNASAIRLVLAALVYATVSLLVYANTTGLAPFLIELLMTTPIGAVGGAARDIVSNAGFVAIVINIISAGFTGFLIQALFEKGLESDYNANAFLRRIVTIVYYAILTVAACILGVQLGWLWDLLASFGVTLFQSLWGVIQAARWNFLDILLVIGAGIGLILLLWFGVNLAFIAVREFLCIFCYTIFAVLVCLIFFLLAYALAPSTFWDTATGEIIGVTILVGLMLTPDYLHATQDGI